MLCVLLLVRFRFGELVALITALVNKFYIGASRWLRCRGGSRMWEVGGFVRRPGTEVLQWCPGGRAPVRGLGTRLRAP